MPDLLDLSSRIIDENILDEPVNRPTQQLSELAPGVAIVESFSHIVVFDTPDGLVCFDASSQGTGAAALESLRRWSTKPVNTLVYTHGHVDHIGGSGAFSADALRSRAPSPHVVAQREVLARLERYELTNGYNLTINARQFGGSRLSNDMSLGATAHFVPADALRPDTVFEEHLSLSVGGVDLELHHGRGETDDHLWAWVPSQRAVCVGDFVIWNFPNAGNPQKVQRYPTDWARALRSMAALSPELLLPAHGLPIAGADRIAMVLDDMATALERLVADTLELMNAGATLDHVIHTVRVDPDLLAKPYLRPLYDEPEFVIRNTWRLYGGWYDGNPANLKPAPNAAFAAEVAALAGGFEHLIERARSLAADGELRLACQLAELATQAAPQSRAGHAARAEIYEQRRRSEASLMAKGIYGWAVRESRGIAEAP